MGGPDCDDAVGVCGTQAVLARRGFNRFLNRRIEPTYAGRADASTMRLAILLAAVTAFLLVPSTTATHVPAGEISWACGAGGSGQKGHPDHCGIDPVGGGPAVESAGEPAFSENAWIDGDEKVLGVVVDGDARAYPLRMLSQHEVVNDEVGGTPLAVTYCPLCGSGVTFKRSVTIDGQTRELTFTASGFLWNHDLVMWDPQTGTLWNQIRGEPIGTLVDDAVEPGHPDAELEIVSTAIVTWDAWRDRHPDARMLEKVRSSYRDPYVGYYESCSIGVSGGSECDVDGLHPKAVVVGVDHGGVAVAYPVEGVQAAGGVVVHEVDGQRFVVSVGPGGASGVFDADGHDFNRSGGGWVDEDGNRWDLAEGARADGADELPAIDHVVLFWFAWRDHQPDTQLWQAARDDGGASPAPGLLAVAVVLVAVAFSGRRP